MAKILHTNQPQKVQSQRLKRFAKSKCVEANTFLWCIYETLKSSMVCIGLFNSIVVCILVITVLKPNISLVQSLIHLTESLIHSLKVFERLIETIQGLKNRFGQYLINDKKPNTRPTADEAKEVSGAGVRASTDYYDYIRKSFSAIKSSTVDSAYDKFHDIPAKVLKFRKAGESTTKLFHSRIAGFTKSVVDKTKKPSNEVNIVGVAETVYGLAKSTCMRLEPVTEQYVVSAWNSLNHVPWLNRVANVVVPAATYYSETYNQTVQQTMERGYRVSQYLPLVPIERIATVFNSAAEPQVVRGRVE